MKRRHEDQRQDREDANGLHHSCTLALSPAQLFESEVIQKAPYTCQPLFSPPPPNETHYLYLI